MNPKLQKVMGEIEKIKGKIAEQQARLRELEKQRTELENAEIVNLFRKEKLTESEFSEFVRAMRAQEAAPTPPQAAPATAGGYRAPESTYQSEQEDNGQ